jgi:mRNA-degrading endonuclease toxin of MazEF toxin-antitoxin module
VGAFTSGEVVLAPFPFSGQEAFKVRPILILLALPAFDDYLACLITSQDSGDPDAITLNWNDIVDGTLGKDSYIRPLYLFSISESQIHSKIGTLRGKKLHQVIETIKAAFDR